MVQPRKWPELSLKSPGIKPRRHTSSTGSILSSSSNSTHTGSQLVGKKPYILNTCDRAPSPTGNTFAHEFSVFASVNIQGSATQNLYKSHVSLTSILYGDESDSRDNSKITTMQSNNADSNKCLLNHKINETIDGVPLNSSPQQMEMLIENFSNKISNNCSISETTENNLSATNPSPSSGIGLV